MTWWIRRLCSFTRSSTSRFQICNCTNIRWIAVKEQHILCEIRGISIVTQRIFIRSQIWQWEVKERLTLHNVHTEHVMVWTELKYWIGAKIVNLRCRVFGGKTGPFPTVWVFGVVRPEQPIERTCNWWQALIEKHGILEIIIIYLYVLLKNNVVIKKEVNENTRKAAKTMWMMDYAKSTDCILWIHPWQNERQWSVNNVRLCKSGNYKFIWSWLYIVEALAAFIGKNHSNTLPASYWKWASTELQRLFVMRPGYSHCRLVAGSHTGIIGHLYRQNRLRYPPCPILNMSINGASMIVGHVSWVRWATTGCKQA